MRILELNENTRKDILSNLLKRSPNSYGEYEGRVSTIIDDIKTAAMKQYLNILRNSTVMTLTQTT